MANDFLLPWDTNPKPNFRKWVGGSSKEHTYESVLAEQEFQKLLNKESICLESIPIRYFIMLMWMELLESKVWKGIEKIDRTRRDVVCKLTFLKWYLDNKLRDKYVEAIHMRSPHDSLLSSIFEIVEMPTLRRSTNIWSIYENNVKFYYFPSVGIITRTSLGISIPLQKQIKKMLYSNGCFQNCVDE